MNRHYFDHNATTPVSREVLEALTAALTDTPGNASSVHHFGQEARRRLEVARLRMALFLGGDPKETVFTSGGTEADNLAILGAARASSKRHIVTTTIEHPAVLAAVRQLECEGFSAAYVPSGGDGVVDPDAVRRALRPDTALVSVMHANNETGVVQPVAEIARIARECGATMHSDGVQAAGKIDVDVAALGVDLYSVSGHKFYAPKGCGALFVRSGVKLQPLQFGGRHERERRPGTENVPGAAALARAADLAELWLETESTRLAGLRDRLERGILDRIADTGVNGGGAPRTPNTTNIWFDGIEGEAMVIALDLRGFAVSTGAACSSGAIEPSHVLIAMGLPPARAKASIRFSLGRANTEDHVDELIEAVAASAAHLRRLSPVYGR